MLVALYPRVSTQEQALNGYSIDEQIERMQKYCEAMGWTVYKTYTDAGHSGADTDRPGLQLMIKDIKAGKIDKVLVYKLDRLSRSQLDTLYLIEKVFLTHGTDFVSMSENFDTSTPFGRAMIGILAVFAQLEREQIKERMSMGREARAKLGKFHGSNKVPIGYDYVDGELLTNEFEKMQVIQVFEMYAQGASPYKIADTLNEAGQTHRYGKWRDKTIRELIEKKTYLGYTYHKGTWYRGTHEPFIEQDLFYKVQEIKKQKSEEHAKYNRRSGKAVSYLGGYLCCARCDAKYTKTTQRSTLKDGSHRKHAYYQCNSRTKKVAHLVKDPTCKNKHWRMNDLDTLVFDEIKKLAIDPAYIAEIKASQPEDARPAVIQSEIDKLDEQVARLMDLYTIGEMPVDVIQDRIQVLSQKKSKLGSELARIAAERENRLSNETTFEIVKTFEDVLNRGDFDEIRTVVGALIERVEIDHEDVTIRWTFV